MEAKVKTEPVWLQKDQTVLDCMKREGEKLTFLDYKDEFLRTDVQGLRHSTVQSVAVIKDEAHTSDYRNEDMITEINFEENSFLEASMDLHLCVEMEAEVKPKPVRLLEDQVVLDCMKREGEILTFPDNKDEFLRMDVQGLRYSTVQNVAGINDEAHTSDDRNEDMKTEINFEEHSILENSSELHLSVEKDAVVKPEPAWLLEDQAVLDGMKREGEAITFPDIKDEFLKVNVQGSRHSIFQNDAGFREEALIPDDRNRDMKTEMDFEDHSILEESSEYIPSLKRSGITGARQCGEININTDKLEHIVTKHLKSHTGGKRFKCELCNKSFTRHSNLLRHMRTHTGDKRFKCEVCSKCFAQCTHLTDHIRTHTGDKPFKCKVCSKGFRDRSSLAKHLRTHTGDKPFKCELCSKCFKARSTLTDHLRIHAGDKPFKCEMCSKCFIHRSKLTYHIRTHTTDKPFTCKECSKSFREHSSLAKHLRTHTGDKPFKCEMCNKCFTERSTVRDHIRIHTGDKPFKCDVCSKCFIHRSKLTYHIRTHTRDKPFKCKVCCKSFREHSFLSKHLKTHIGDKPFKCEMCNKCFTERSTLTRHIRTHTGDKPFKCEF